MKAYFEHYRVDETTGELKRWYTNRRDWNEYVPSTHGGLTVCRIVKKDGQVVSIGEAHCSKKDSFRYRLGRQIALGRALEAVDEHVSLPKGMKL